MNMKQFCKVNVFLFVIYVFAMLTMGAEAQSAIRNDGQSKSRDNSQIKAVMRFAETVMQHGRDVYGQKHTPLFVDGLNVDTVKPPEKIQSWSGSRHPDEAGMQPWISSNLGDQGNLMRFLVGLSRFTGDPKYQKAMQAAIRYNFDHFQGIGGMLPMGHHRFIELKRDNYHGDVGKGGCPHELKGNFPYYEIFWQANPDGTEKMVQGIWLWHMRKWDNLEFNRHANYGQKLPANPWDQKFDEQKQKGIQSGKYLTFYSTACDMILAAGKLYQFNGDKKALLWAKRLFGRYIYSAHPKTGIIPCEHINPTANRAAGQNFPGNATEPGLLIAYGNGNIRPSDNMFGYGAIAMMRMGEGLGREGEFFTKGVHKYLRAYAKYAYNCENNTFRPMIYDGTDLTGYEIKKSGYFGPKGTVYTPWKAHAGYLVSYALAYRQSRDREIWNTVRSMVRGNGLGELAAKPGGKPQLNMDTDSDDPKLIFALLELYKTFPDKAYLNLARVIGDNILKNRYMAKQGLFVIDRRHLVSNLDSREPLALLSLEAAIKGRLNEIPTYDGSGHYVWGRTSVISGHSVPMPGLSNFELLRPDPNAKAVWIDKSTKKNDADIRFGDPAVVDNVINGQPVFQFDGNDGLFIADDDSLDVKQMTLFTVFKWDSITNAENPTPIGKLPMNKCFQFVMDDYNKAFFTACINNSYRSTPHTYVPGTAAAEIWVGRFDGRVLEFLVNGQSKGSVKSPGSIAVSDGDFFIGGSGHGRLWYKGGVAEVILYNRALSAEQSSQVGTYLKLKYNIKADKYDWRKNSLRKFCPNDISGCVLWLDANTTVPDPVKPESR